MSDKNPFVYTPRAPKLYGPSPVINTPPVPPELPSLQFPRVIRPYAPQKSPYMDYNDPYQINSIADIVLGTFNMDMKRNEFNVGGLDLSQIPILNMIPASFQYLNDAYLQPISKGAWGAVGLNTLTNFSEVLDTFANPVKGYILEGKEGFKDSLGLGENGRKNFDYNTGNIVSDLALELISDPVNWVTLFGKGAVSALVKGATKRGLAELGVETGEELSEKVYKTLTKKIAQGLMKDPEQSLSDLAVKSAQDLMKPGKAILWQGAAPPQFTEAFMKGLKSLSVDDMTVSVLKATDSTLKVGEAVDSTLNKLGIGVPYAAGYVAKKYGGEAFKYIASKIKDGYKPYLTPSGNLDILKYDDIKQYTEKSGTTAGEYYALKEKFPTEQVLDVNAKEAILKEQTNITHFLKTDLKNIPNANMARKSELFKEFLQKRTGLTDDVLMAALQDINVTTNGEYTWLYDWMRRYLDPEQVKLTDQRSAIWGIFNDVKAKVNELKETNSLEGRATLEGYIQEKYNLTIDQLVEQAKDYHIVLGEQFGWISDYYKNSAKDIDLQPVYLHKKEITDQIKAVYKEAKKLEGETRFKLIDDFVHTEHNMGIFDYITRLEEISARHGGIFDGYIEELKRMVTYLQLIDKLSNEYAEKAGIKEAVTHNNALIKIQLELLQSFPETVEKLTSNTFRDMLMLSNPALATTLRNGLLTSFNPKAFAAKLPDGKFTRKILSAYMEDIHAVYRAHINVVLEKLTPEGMEINEAYQKVINEIRTCYEERWAGLEKELRKQAKDLVEQFDVYNYFDDMPKRVNKIIENINPEIEAYRQLVAKKDVLNKTMSYTSFLEVDNAAKKEAFENLLTFRTDPRLKHINDHIVQLERVRELTQTEFFKEYTEGVTTNKATDLFQDILRFFNASSEDFYQDFTNLNIGKVVKDWAEGLDRHDISIFAESLALDFEDLVNAIVKRSFNEFLNSADSIVHSLHLTALQGAKAKETIKPLLDLFEQYDLGTYKPLSADITAESVWYHFKLEQDYVINLMLADKESNAFMNELLDPESEIGTMFKNLLFTGDPEAKRFSVALNNYMNYRQFLDDLYKYVGLPVTDANLPPHKQLLGAFTSTIQKYATYDPKIFLENVDRNFYFLMQQVEMQINSVSAPRSFSLEKYFPELSKLDEYKTLLEGLEEHHALDDAKITWAVCDHELSDVFKKMYGEDAKVIHTDIETNGLNKDTLELTELSGYSRDFGNELNLEFIRKPYNPGAESARLAKKPRFSNTDTELAMLERFFNKVEELYAQGNKNIVLDFYNGNSFDKPVILRKLERIIAEGKSNADEATVKSAQHILALLTSNKYKISDSFKLIQQKYNYTVIDEADKLKLFYFFRDYALKQEKQGSTRLIQPLDPSIAKRLKEMGETIRQELMSKEATSRLKKSGNTNASFNLAKYDPYFQHANAIYAVFQSVKNANRELSHTILKKSLFDEEDFVKYYGASNITQALNSRIVDGEREIFEGTKMIGVKKHLEPLLVQDLFNGKVLDVVQMEYRTNIARDIAREAGRLKNTVVLKYYEKDVKHILEQFLERALRSSRIPEDLKFLKVTEDYLLNFAILRKLITYKTEAFQKLSHLDHYVLNGKPKAYFKADNLLTGLCNDIIPGDLKIILESPERVRVKPYLDDGSLKDELDLERKAIWGEINEPKHEEYLRQAEERKLKAKELAEEKMDREYQEYLERVMKENEKTEKAIAREVDTVASFAKKLELENVPINYKGYRSAVDDLLAHAVDMNEILQNLGRDWDTNGAQRAFVQVRSTSLNETFNLIKAVKERHTTINDVTGQFNQVMKYRKVQDALALQQIDSVLRLSDDALYAHLVNDGKRLIVLDSTELSAIQMEELLNRVKNLEAKNIHVMFEGSSAFLFLDKAVKITTYKDDIGKIYHLVNGQKVLPPKLAPLDVEAVLKDVLTDPADAEIKRALMEVYNKFYKLVGDYDSDYSPHYGSIGESTTPSFYKGYQTPEGDYHPGLYDLLPDSVKKLLPPSEIMYAEEYFHGASFNHSVLGRGGFRKQFDPYTNFDIVSMLSHTMTNQVEHLKSHVEYMNMFFDKSLSIGNGGLTKFSDEDLLASLKNSNEYRLVALIQDSKKGAKVVDMNPQNIKDIQKARELGAVVMAYQTYSTAFGAINSYGIRHGRLNMLHKINYMYKMGYLLTPGAFIRNVIDSVTKNYIAASDDPTGMTQSFLHSWQLHWRYRTTAQDLIKFSTDPVTGTPRITPETTKKFFDSGLSKLTKEEYDFVHGFDVDGPSGGQIKEFEEYFRHGQDLPLYSRIIDSMMQPTKTVEQVCRLAEYLWAIEKDMPTTQAYALIAKTHFDYTIKTDLDKIIELMFPFYTFTMNNIHFWLDSLERFPALGSIIRDVYTPVWNLDDYTPEELQYNRSLQYQILSGNLPLENVFFGHAKNMTLKLNPSFMDVYQLATDPINSIKGKLNPIIQQGMNVAGAGLPKEMQYAYGINAPTSANAMQNILGLLPIAGPIINRLFVQGPKYYERTGNPLNLIMPSVFGATAPSKVYKQKAYKPYTRKRYLKKPRRNYAKKFYTRMQRYYPKKVYSSVGYYMDNFYNKLYTKQGKSRLKSMSLPVTAQTLKYRMKDMYYYYR